jgi:hypothetical protein
MNKEQQRIADRVLKLLALANSTQFEAEASTARNLAEQLIIAHNITLGPTSPAKTRSYHLPRACGGRG